MRSNEHTLLREIREQPRAIIDTLELERREIQKVSGFLRNRRVRFLGMGSSYFASLYATYLFQGLAHVDAEAWLSSEFLHYPFRIDPSDVVIAVSQSGESFETVKAVRFLKKRHYQIVGVTNQPGSNLARLSDRLLLTHAGAEKASSTKTFVATLALLNHLAVSIAMRTGRISGRKGALLYGRLLRCASLIEEKLPCWEKTARTWATALANCRSAVVLGRGYDLAGALQGALLLKEVAKIPAEGMTGGEFMHGPIEIASRKLFVVVIAGGRTSPLMKRLATYAKQIGARVLLLTPEKVGSVDSVRFEENYETLVLFPSVAMIELLAYFTAIEKHTNPDHFRFISKVTRAE